MKFKESLGNQTLEVVESPMILPFVYILDGLHVLLHLWCPPSGDPHLNLKFKHLAEKITVLFPCKTPLCFNAAGF